MDSKEVQVERKGKRLKVALLFSGQVRKINIAAFRMGLKILLEGLDYKIYLSAWSEIGRSGNHKQARMDTIRAAVRGELRKPSEAATYLEKLFNGWEVEEMSVECQKEWYRALSEPWRSIQNHTGYSPLTLNSLAQLYQIQKSFELVEDPDSFDAIIRCRFDSVFVAPIKEDVENLVSSELKHINFGKAFYPERVYDIFFMAKGSTAAEIFRTWRDVGDLIGSNISSTYDARDACRLIYVNAIQKGSIVSSLDIRYCDVYRAKIPYLYGLLRWGLSKNVKSFALYASLLRILVSQ